MFVYNQYILFFLLTFVFSSYSNAQNEDKITPKAEKGVIDLQEWDFDKNGIIKLDGEWEFYWNSFLTDEKSDYQTNENSHYIEVPGTWNGHIVDNEEIKSYGFATYKLQVKLNKKEELAIKYLSAATSCEIFVDGILLYSSGQPAKTKETTIPSYRPDIVTFFPKSKEIEIVLHIANFHHRKGGQWEPLIIGTKEQIAKRLNIRIFSEILFVGFIIIMAVFHFTLFSRYTNEKPSLYFAIFAILISIRFIVSGEYSIYMLGDFNWSLLVRIDYLSFYLAILFFLFFLRSLYPREVNKIPVIIITSVVITFSASVLILPPSYFSYGLMYYHLFTVAAGIYVFYVLYKAQKNKREGAKYFIYGFIVLFICMIHDFLKINEFIYSVSISSFGLTLFILFQAYFLSLRIGKAFESNKKLSIELQKQNNEYSFLNNRYKEQNKILLYAKEKAEESDWLKSAFLANMSHEIRTPMNGILGFTRLLKKPHLSGEKRHEYIDVIRKSGIRMLNTVNDIIDISKIDSGQMEILIDEVRISDEIESLYAFFKPEAEEKGLQFILINDLPNNEVVLYTDLAKFNSILTNLIKNAIKFTHNGSIEIACKKKDGYFLGSVKDTGVGVPNNRKEAIFNRFEQAEVKDNRAFEGSGLGLTITKAYLEMLGGEIWLKSVEGKGSHFYFTIPYRTFEEKIPKEQTILTDDIREMQTEKLKIVIVEDDEASAIYLKVALEDIAKEIIHTQNGEEAIKLCKTIPDIDVILMDIKIPGIGGYETTRKIREFNNDIPIIAQTAFALPGDKEKAIKIGCDDYISKPINTEELLQLINKHVKVK